MADRLTKLDAGLKTIKLDAPLTGPALVYVGIDPATGEVLGVFDKDGVCIGRPEDTDG